MVVGSGSPSHLTHLVTEENFELNDILQGNNAVATADLSCFNERRGNAHIGDAEATEFNEALSSLRWSSSEPKFQKASNRKYTRKGSKKALDRTSDLLSAAVRSKRSCLNRSARVTGWGLIESLSKYIKRNTGGIDQRSRMVKSGGKSRKKEKVHVDASSHGLNSSNHSSSVQVSLKLKLVRKGKNAMKTAPLDNNQPDLSKCLKNVTDESSVKSLECISDIKLEKSTMVLENSGIAADSVDKVSEVTLMPGKGNCVGGSNLLDKEVQRSVGSADERPLNSDTSPDFVELEVRHTGGMDSLYSTQDPTDDGPPAMPNMRKKKEKKEPICQLGDLDVQNRLLGSSAIDNIEIPENYGENGTKGNIDARLDIRLKAKENKKSKSLKSKEKTKVKSKPVSTPRLKMDSSRKAKGDKWKLIGNYSISENGISDFAHRKEDGPESAGKPVIDASGNNTNFTVSGVAYEDVASLQLPAMPGNAVQQRTQPRTAWVCCDDCVKWRCIPANLADIIDETNCRWTCKDNQDKAFADCLVPQEKPSADINAELNISEDEDGSNAHLSGKHYSLKHLAVLQQSSWMLIKSNIFLHRSRNSQTLDEIMVCHCKFSRDGKLGCGDECLNRMLNIECVEGTCPCGDVCSNQQFQKQSYANLTWFRSGKKGYGLQVLEDITEGKFLIEYVGEVLDLPTYEARQRVYASKGHKHFYFMTLNGSEVIDACAKGNLGRFINHSCDPNCRTEKWMVNGEICIGLFAIRDIKKGEELTFDYNYVRVFGAAAKKCHCGSSQCRGYIGCDRLDNEVVVQSDSDEEFPEPVVLYENGEIVDNINMMSKSSSLDVTKEKKDDILLQSDADILSDEKEITKKLEESLTSIDSKLRSIEEGIVHSSVLELEIVDKSRLNVQQESPSNRISLSITSPKGLDSSTMNVLYPESLKESVDAEFNTCTTETTNEKAVQSKGHPRMKISRPSKSGKSKKSIECGSGATIDKAVVASKKSQTTPTKNLVESSAKHHFETVEEKLNELLDDAGGICKRKDAFKGYLKLLVLTAASGDSNYQETIQSNKDLSMILDAILKTRSRTVLSDILNKNGLQMLHSMVKKCRGNFNMIPILRKLLKVFEFLAERKILNLDHINGDPPRPGVESFRDSILNLTEHKDRKVHQIARNFRDRWVPRPVKKFNCVDRPLESMHDMMEGPSHIGESLTNTRLNGKRKSRWDQSPEAVSPHAHIISDGIHHVKKDNEMQEIEEDAPPGFSCPAYAGPLNSPSQIPLGYAQQRFNSGLPVAYGIPFNYVQEFGTPQASSDDHWVIAPGMPFRPFPPLPLTPRHQSSATLPNTISTVNTHLQQDRGPCNFQRRPRNCVQKPPWKSNRSSRNFPKRPSGLGATVNDRNKHPENLNSCGVDFGRNS